MARERIEIEDTMLTNIPRGKRKPTGKQWKYYLMGWRVAERGGRFRAVFTVSGKTKAAVNAELRKFVKRRDVTLLSDRKARAIHAAAFGR